MSATNTSTDQNAATDASPADLNTNGEDRRRIEIYDTTLRDGTQGEGIAFSLVDKIKITQRLDALGVDFIEGG